MFTGIIEEIGEVAGVTDLGGGGRLTIRADLASDLHIDQSICVAGACQTVVARDEDTFTVVAIEETLRKTTLGALETGDGVNLERALLPSDRLDGHIVQGHVDSVGTITDSEKEATDTLYTIRYDPAKARYLIPEGSVAIDGISLTVARLDGDTFTVAIIPHTRDHTTVGAWATGGEVNLEFDVLGKYVARSRALES